jgi:hypothetical protein
LYRQSINPFEILFVVGISGGDPLVHPPESHDRIGKFDVFLLIDLKGAHYATEGQPYACVRRGIVDTNDLTSCSTFFPTDSLATFKSYDV